jgi:hypothetical protein
MSYDTATVITPFSWASPAIELGNRRWRKRILPVGDVAYQGRTLHFTRDYLSSLVEAFNNRAYDQVSFQLADAKNSHTNDPERHRGTITGLELADDGLYATTQVTEAGERILAENPMLGVSARIVENYERSDGKFYPYAIQHILGTLDPRIPALGEWQPVDMANSGGQVVIDLSGSAWDGEPGPPDTTLTDAELQEWLTAIDEADAEMALNSGWRDTEAAGYLSEFDGTFTASYQAEQAREQARADAHLEDLTRPVIRAEDRMARAMSRIESGIFDTSRVSTFAGDTDRAIELTATTGQGLCGDPDPFGRCSSRYHDLQCIHGIGTDWQASEPPRETYSMALSNFASGHDLGGEPASYGDPADPDGPGYAFPQRTLELASRLNQSWGLHSGTGITSPAPDTDELFGTPYRGDAYSAMAAELGRDNLAGELPPGEFYPDVSEIARQMGLK